MSLLTSSSFFIFLSFSSFSSPSYFPSSLLISRDDDDETISFCDFSLILFIPESRQFDEEEDDDDAEDIPKGRGQWSTGGSSWCGGPPLLLLMNRLGVGGGGAGGRGLPLLGVVDELLGLPEGCLVGTVVVVLPHPELGSFDAGLGSVPMQLGHLVLGVGSGVSFDGFSYGGGGG